MGEMRVIDMSGDCKHIWDPENEEEVSAVREIFETLIEKGYQAFSVKKNGEKGRKIKEFDPDAGMVILTPRFAGGC